MSHQWNRQALGSVYSSELLEGDRAREKAKDKQAKLFPPGDRALGAVGSAAHRKQAIPATTGAALAQGQVTTTGG